MTVPTDDIRRRSTALATALVAGLLAHAPAAQAQLHEDIERIARSWRAAGATVVVDKTRFLNSDERVGVALPVLPRASCTTVVFLGGRSLGFRVDIEGSTEGSGSEHVLATGGLVFLERCGVSPFERAVVVNESARGAFETLLARSVASLPPLRSILPERTDGHVSPQPDPGLLPPLPSPEDRAALAEERARRDGAAIHRRMIWVAGPDGKGSADVTLEPGCHTLALFAPEARGTSTRRRGTLDLDAELHDSADDHLLARDQTDAPDARLATCLADTMRVSALFAGAPGDARVLVSHAARSLPEHLPGIWGAEVRARIAQTLLAREVVSLPREPVLLAQGGSGAVPIPLQLEPGACYLAVAALVQRATHGIGLRVRVDNREADDARGGEEAGAAVAFCSGPSSRGLAQVETRGAPLFGWGLAVYRMQSGVWAAPW